MKKTEAEKEVQKIIEARKKVFCPICKDICRDDCELYIKPEAKELKCLIEPIKNSDKIWVVNGGYCDVHIHIPNNQA